MARKKKNSNSNKIVWNYGTYGRLSRETMEKSKGFVKASQSIENQENMLDEYIEYLKEEFPEQIFNHVKDYSDDGISGTTSHERTDYEDLKQDIINKNLNMIVFVDLSRGFRDIAEQTNFLEKFCVKHKVRVIVVGDEIDTYLNPDVIYDFEVAMKGIDNDRYAYKTSRAIKRVFGMKRRKGLHINGFAPYGYKKDPDNKYHLIIDENSAPIVQMIFRLYTTGDGDGEPMGKTTIAKYLNKLGISSPAKYKQECGSNYKNHTIKNQVLLWGYEAIHRILNEPMYLGHMVQGRYGQVSHKVHEQIKKDESEWSIVENTHEPIIDEDIYNIAKDIQSRNIKRSNKTKDNYLFSGLLECGDCHRAMRAQKTKDYKYYICTTYSKYSKEKCTRHTISEKKTGRYNISSCEFTN